MLPPCAMITPSAPDFGHFDLGGDRVRLVLVTHDRVLRQAAHAAEENLHLPLDQYRPAGEVGIIAFGDAIVERQHVVARSLDQPEPLQLLAIRNDQRYQLPVARAVL